MCVKISAPKKFMFFFARCSCSVPKGGAAEGKIYFNMGKLKQQACRVESQSREAAHMHTKATQHNNNHFPFVASRRWRHWWTRSCTLLRGRSQPPMLSDDVPTGNRSGSSVAVDSATWILLQGFTPIDCFEGNGCLGSRSILRLPTNTAKLMAEHEYTL